jgi:uncharacterized membrane protein YjjP (DUF1212 family)
MVTLNVNSSLDSERKAASTAQDGALDVLMSFGASMLRAGNPAVRTRECMEMLAAKLGFDEMMVGLSLDGITASVCRSGELTTAMRIIGPPGVNAWRIGELEKLAESSGLETTSRELAAKLAEIESAPPLYSSKQMVAAIGLASGGFAFLNGAGAAEMTAAAISGGIGQWLRLWLSRRQLNQYGAATLSAMLASGMYVLVAALANTVGFEFARYPAGFIASVLFLVPGFPLIAALFDLMHYQTVAALSRLAYGMMILMAVAFGLSVVVEVVGVDLSRQPAIEVAYPLKLLLRAAASFIAGCAFAISFNSAAPAVLAAGFVALGANDLRLVLTDAGVRLAPAAFFGSLTIGLLALLAHQRFALPRMATTVAPAVIMIPGLYAFQMIVLFNRGQVLEALQAAALFGFVVGALAMGLVTARFFSR